MSLTTETYVLPAHWASGLIYGDWSGMDPDDIEQAERFLAVNNYPHFVDCTDDTELTRHHDANMHSLLTECVTFTALINP